MKSIDDYLHLPYHVVLVQDEDEDGNVGYVAEVQELPGCISQGDTPDEAVESVRDAMEGWITVALADGKDIPVPTAPVEHNGKFLVRAPKTLHAALVEAANREGTSLNQFVVAALAAAVSWRSTSRTVPAWPTAPADIEAALREHAMTQIRTLTDVVYSGSEVVLMEAKALQAEAVQHSAALHLARFSELWNNAKVKEAMEEMARHADDRPPTPLPLAQFRESRSYG